MLICFISIVYILLVYMEGEDEAIRGILSRIMGEKDYLTLWHICHKIKWKECYDRI